MFCFRSSRSGEISMDGSRLHLYSHQPVLCWSHADTLVVPGPYTSASANQPVLKYCLPSGGNNRYICMILLILVSFDPASIFALQGSCLNCCKVQSRSGIGTALHKHMNSPHRYIHKDCGIFVLTSVSMSGERPAEERSPRLQPMSARW